MGYLRERTVEVCISPFYLVAGTERLHQQIPNFVEDPPQVENMPTICRVSGALTAHRASREVNRMNRIEPDPLVPPLAIILHDFKNMR